MCYNISPTTIRDPGWWLPPAVCPSTASQVSSVELSMPHPSSSIDESINPEARLVRSILLQACIDAGISYNLTEALITVSATFGHVEEGSDGSSAFRCGRLGALP
jgi:hypothetical protein